MSSRTKHLLGLAACVGLAMATIVAATPNRSPKELIAHEWGTFTTVAGDNGASIDWLPLGGPTDLPCFVEHFQNRPTIKIVPDYAGGPIDYEHARGSLVGKVRMETPVLYFYGPQDTPPLNVKVRFPHGIMTEWYPHADVMEVIAGAKALDRTTQPSTIEWNNVRVGARTATAFPSGAGESHYYAARATEASPLSVGDQHERFLFYRGIANFNVPLTAGVLPNGRVTIASLGAAAVPEVVLFERRGDHVGFRLLGALHGDTTVDTPALDASLPTLRSELARALTVAGLYQKEADAMLETWHDSWFEEGVRVFYVVPPRLVDAILPLEIRPAPASVVRVFVGRMEVLTPSTVNTVAHAIDVNDAATLDRYGRFLGPIADRLLSKISNVSETAKIRSVTNAALVSYLKRSAICE
jgi:hypothetical protein